MIPRLEEHAATMRRRVPRRLRVQRALAKRRYEVQRERGDHTAGFKRIATPEAYRGHH